MMSQSGKQDDSSGRPPLKKVSSVMSSDCTYQRTPFPRPRLEKMASIASNDSKEMDEYIRYNYELGWANSKRFIKELVKDNIDTALLNEELQRHAESRRYRGWRAQCLGKFRSNIAQILLCILVLIDSGIVIAEIILEIRSIQNYKELFSIQAQNLIYDMASHDFKWTGIWCSGKNPTHQFSPGHASPHNQLNSNGRRGSTASIDEHRLETLKDFSQCWRTFVQESTHAKIHGCDPGLQRKCLQINSTELRTPDPSSLEMLNPAMLHHASEVMHFVSIGVTGLFIFCIVLKLVCLGRKFFTDVYEVTDALVILISFVSDISYIKLDSQEISAMVILLLWRIARLINAMLMYERQRCEFRVALQKRARRLQERKVDSLEMTKELCQASQLSLIIVFRNTLPASKSSLVSEGALKTTYENANRDEQTQNALKSIAALTTGFMGGLVGAPIAHQETIARFSNTKECQTADSAGSPVQSTNQGLYSLLFDGYAENGASSATYDSLTSSKAFLTPLIHEENASNGDLNDSLHSLSPSAKKGLAFRNQADNLVRNVLLHQLSSAIEESETSLARQTSSHRSLVDVPETGNLSVLKGLLGGNYRKKVSFGKSGSPPNPGPQPNRKRRQTFAQLSNLQCFFPGLSNTPIFPSQHPPGTNAAFDIDEETPFLTRSPESPRLRQPDPVTDEPGQSPLPPILQINASVVVSNPSGESSGVCSRRSSEVVMSGLGVSGGGLSIAFGLARRNSYCPSRLAPPDREELLMPGRKTKSEQGSQPTIVRTLSERRFDVCLVPSPTPCDVVHNPDVLSNSVAVL